MIAIVSRMVERFGIGTASGGLAMRHELPLDLTCTLEQDAWSRIAAEEALAKHRAPELPLAMRLGQYRFDEMDVRLDVPQKTVWAVFKSETSPSFTHTLLDDLLRLNDALHDVIDGQDGDESEVKFVVCASRMQGIFNLGGDLELVGRLVRARDRKSLRAYAHKCCEMIYHGYTAFRQPVVTIGLVQGDALGGGFECAMACGVLIAEKRARFGMPEILFNMFPGMGAYSLLQRRVGQVKAEEMILSGKIYSAEEMHALGLVDVVCQDGEGEAAVREYVARNTRRQSTICALHDVRRRCGGLTKSELLDVTDRWVEEALRLDEPSLRRMERLRSAQVRRMKGMLQEEATL